MPLVASAQEGGFGTVIFLVSRSKPEDKFALKKAKVTNTDGACNKQSY